MLSRLETETWNDSCNMLYFLFWNYSTTHTPLKSSGTKLTVSHHWHSAKSDGFHTLQEHSAASVSTDHLLLWHKFTRSIHCTAHTDSCLSVALTVIEIISFAQCNSTFKSCWVLLPPHMLSGLHMWKHWIYILTSKLWHTQKQFLNFDIYAQYLQCESPTIILIFTRLE